LGEGGAISTNDAQLAEKLRMLRDHGSLRKYEHSLPGFNFRLEGLQGGLLAVKLPHLDTWNNQRRAIAAVYNEKLRDVSVTLPVEMPYGKHVYHLYVIQVEHRDRVKQQLSEMGIDAGLHYPVPLHLQNAYRQLGYKAGDFPVSERLSQQILSLPIYPGLSVEATEYVTHALVESRCQAAASTAR
jgi:dTDP-4-amino-4,6-dideoxygalactose transaminase